VNKIYSTFKQWVFKDEVEKNGEKEFIKETHKDSSWYWKIGVSRLKSPLTLNCTIKKTLFSLKWARAKFEKRGKKQRRKGREGKGYNRVQSDGDRLRGENQQGLAIYSSWLLCVASFSLLGNGAGIINGGLQGRKEKQDWPFLSFTHSDFMTHLEEKGMGTWGQKVRERLFWGCLWGLAVFFCSKYLVYQSAIV
jgi:hypothetical protein